MATGGPIETVSLDGRNFAVSADSDAGVKIGGSENEVSPNGNRTVRLIKTPVPWMVSDLVIEIDDSRDDHEFLQGLANRQTLFPVAVIFASGVIRQGTGQIVGEISMSTAQATASVSLSGQGELTRQ